MTENEKIMKEALEACGGRCDCDVHTKVGHDCVGTIARRALSRLNTASPADFGLKITPQVLRDSLANERVKRALADIEATLAPAFGRECGEAAATSLRIAREALAASPAEPPVCDVCGGAGELSKVPGCGGQPFTCPNCAHAGPPVALRPDEATVEALRNTPCPLLHAEGRKACSVLFDVGGDSEPAFCWARIRSLTSQPGGERK